MLGRVLQYSVMSLPYVALGLLLSLILTYILIFILPRIGFVDIPRGRHQHEKPVPRGGGIAIAGAFLLTVFLACCNSVFSSGASDFLQKFWLPAGIILITGVLDDRYELRSWIKLIAQIAAGAVMYFEDGGISHFFAFQLPAPLALIITVFWCIIIINAFNLIDGLDGVAAGLAAISSFLLAVWTLLTGDSIALAAVQLIFCGCCLGFLRYNFSPAKIFMGDTGSMFLGLFFAYMSMRYSSKAVTMTALLVPLAAIGLPVFDVMLAIWRRFWRKYIKKDSGSGIMQGDHDHLHHRILKETGTTRKAAYRMYFLSLAISGIAMLCTLWESSVPALFFLLFLLIFFIMIRCSSIELFDTLSSVAEGIRRPHRNVILTILHPLFDSLIIILAFYMSRHICHNLLGASARKLLLLTNIAPFILFLCLSGIYRTFWLRVGIIQYYKLIRLLLIAGIVGYIGNSLICLYIFNMPRNEMWKVGGFYTVYGLLALSLILVERFLIHYYESFGYRRLFIRNQGKYSTLPRVLIYGGGLLCRLYITRQFCGFKDNRQAVKIIGIMDDDRALRRLNVYGFEVMGSVYELEEILARRKFDIIVITCNDAGDEKMQILKNFCRENHVVLQEFVCDEKNVEL